MLSSSYSRWCGLTAFVPASFFLKIFGFPKNVLFIWIPKCAGKSITRFFQNLGHKFDQVGSGAEGFINLKKVKSYGYKTFGHFSIDSLLEKKIIKPYFVESAFKFAVLRSPEDRFISLFNHYKNLKLSNKYNINTFEDLINKITNEYIPKPDLYNWNYLSQCRPQIDWLPQHEKNKITFLNYKKLEAEFFQICKKLKINKSKLPLENVVKRDTTILSDNIKEKIYTYYKEDLELIKKVFPYE